MYLSIEKFKCESCGNFCTEKIIKSEDIYNDDSFVWVKTVPCEKCEKIKLITYDTDGNLNIIVLENFEDLKAHLNMDISVLKKSLYYIKNKNYLIKYMRKDDEYIYYTIGIFLNSFNILFYDSPHCSFYWFLAMDKDGVVEEKKHRKIFSFLW